ncbi:hypothetical protein [Zhongshania marina]|uniref:hypothetical protein n=1 Tax=Zhongshania marina TaxID=2304603 RepID=UPI001314DAD8
MIKLLLLPFYLAAGLLTSIVIAPITLIAAAKANKARTKHRAEMREITARLSQELGRTICPLCFEKNQFRCTPAPERKPSSTNASCILCHGKGVL